MLSRCISDGNNDTQFAEDKCGMARGGGGGAI